MDLLQQLGRKINSIPDLKQKISGGFIDNDHNFVIHDDMGSRVIDEDMSGMQIISMVYQVTLRGAKYGEATQELNKVGAFLNQLEPQDVQTDGSYNIEEIDAAQQPIAHEIDETGTGIYFMTFTVQIEKMRR